MGAVITPVPHVVLPSLLLHCEWWCSCCHCARHGVTIAVIAPRMVHSCGVAVVVVALRGVVAIGGRAAVGPGGRGQWHIHRQREWIRDCKG